MTLGKKLKDRRLKLGLTLDEVGKMVGVSKSTVMKWETGYVENMRRDKIALLAKALKVSPLWVMGIEELDYSPANENITLLPIVGHISCGNGVLAYEDIEGYEPPKEWVAGGEFFYLRAKGDSMTGARIQEGDLLLIRKQPEVENGEIAAVLVEEEAVLKKVYMNNGQLVLQAENPRYPPVFAPPADVCIIGKLKKVVIDV